jgi:cytochrome b561
MLGSCSQRLIWLLKTSGSWKRRARAEHYAISRYGSKRAGQWLTYAVIILHIGATGWHVAVRRDGALFRMLPEQKAASDIAQRVHNTP